MEYINDCVMGIYFIYNKTLGGINYGNEMSFTF